MNKTKTNLIISGSLFLTFIIFTLLVKLVDVNFVYTAEIGFSSLNKTVFDGLGTSEFFYDLTEILGLLTFAIIIFFAGLGGYQLIKNKSIKHVDVKIIILGAFYVLVFLFYIAFEIVVINYRPVLIDGEIEASYPSSHSMLSICVTASAMIMANEYLKNKNLKIACYGVGSAIILVMVVGRLLSGVHWFTDIIGAILLSVSLIYAFYTAITYYKEKCEK